MHSYSHANKALAALISAGVSCAAVVFHRQLNVSPEVVSAVTALALPALVYAVPNIAPEIEDGGKLDNVEQLTATIATKAKDNINAGNATLAASSAEAAAGAALLDPAAVRAADGMQRTP